MSSDIEGTKPRCAGSLMSERRETDKGQLRPDKLSPFFSFCSTGLCYFNRKTRPFLTDEIVVVR